MIGDPDKRNMAPGSGFQVDPNTTLEHETVLPGSGLSVFFQFFLFFFGFFPVLVLKTTLKFTKLDIFCILDPS